LKINDLRDHAASGWSDCVSPAYRKWVFVCFESSSKKASISATASLR